MNEPATLEQLERPDQHHRSGHHDEERFPDPIEARHLACSECSVLASTTRVRFREPALREVRPREGNRLPAVSTRTRRCQDWRERTVSVAVRNRYAPRLAARVWGWRCACR